MAVGTVVIAVFIVILGIGVFFPTLCRVIDKLPEKSLRRKFVSFLRRVLED